MIKFSKAQKRTLAVRHFLRMNKWTHAAAATYSIERWVKKNIVCVLHTLAGTLTLPVLLCGIWRLKIVWIVSRNLCVHVWYFMFINIKSSHFHWTRCWARNRKRIQTASSVVESYYVLGKWRLVAETLEPIYDLSWDSNHFNEDSNFSPNSFIKA